METTTPSPAYGTATRTSAHDNGHDVSVLNTLIATLLGIRARLDASSICTPNEIVEFFGKAGRKFGSGGEGRWVRTQNGIHGRPEL